MSSAASDTVRLPYVVRSGFILPRQPPRKPLEFKPGDCGTVYRFDKPSGTILVSIPRPIDTDKVTWIANDDKFITIGTGVVGQVTPRFYYTEISTDTVLSQSVPGSKTFITMYKFFCCIRSQKDLQPLMRPVLTKATNQKLKDMCDAVLKGIQRAGLATVLEQPDFTLDQIIATATQVSDLTMKQQSASMQIKCLYMWVHSDNKKRGIYVGKTKNLAKRCSQHLLASKTSMSTHYQYWRKTTKHRCFILCNLADSQSSWSDVLDFGELFLATIGLHAYCHWVLHTSWDAVQGGNSFDPDVLDDVGDTEATIEEAPIARLMAVEPANPSVRAASDQLLQNTSNDNSLRHNRQRECALKITRLYTSIMSNTGWPGGRQRTAFGCDHGLNSSTPLSVWEIDQSEETPFTCVDVPGVMKIYSRTPVLVSSHDPKYNRIVLYDRDSNRLVTPLPKEKSPKYKTPVHLLYEIMHNNKVHPFEFARLPDLPDADDWLEARGLAIAYMWQENNRWFKRYVQHGLRNSWSDKAPPKPYCEAISLIRALKQQTIMKPHAAWIGFWKPVTLSNISFNWLTQTVDINTETKSTEAYMGQELNIEGRSDMLKRAGAQNIGAKFPQLNAIRYGSPNAAGIGANRTMCDWCHHLSLTREVTCVQVPGTEDCYNCLHFRRIHCSWTHFSKWTQAWQALLFSKPLVRDAVATSEVTNPAFSAVGGL